MTHAARQRTTQLRPWALWFALFVAWVGAIVPTVSHALVWSQGGAPGYLSICTTTGPAVVKSSAPTPGDDSSSDQGAAGAMQHCPFCLHASDRSAPPPEPVVCGMLLQPRQHVLAVWRTHHPVLTFYSSAAPRGPPAFS